MRTMADEIRREQRGKVRAMTAERAAPVRSAVDDGIALLAAGQHVTRAGIARRTPADLRGARRHVDQPPIRMFDRGGEGAQRPTRKGVEAARLAVGFALKHDADPAC
jgi:hypothetical protein